MELINNLKALLEENKFNKEEILKITSSEDLFFILFEAVQTKEKEYNNLFNVFEEIRNLAEENRGMNIFSENLTLKFYYFSFVYGIDSIILNSLLEILGPVYLDFELEKRFIKEDEFAQFYFKRYREFRQDSELSLYRILEKMDVNALKLEGEEIQTQFAKMRNILGIEE